MIRNQNARNTTNYSRRPPEATFQHVAFIVFQPVFVSFGRIEPLWKPCRLWLDLGSKELFGASLPNASHNPTSASEGTTHQSVTDIHYMFRYQVEHKFPRNSFSSKYHRSFFSLFYPSFSTFFPNFPKFSRLWISQRNPPPFKSCQQAGTMLARFLRHVHFPSLLFFECMLLVTKCSFVDR